MLFAGYSVGAFPMTVDEEDDYVEWFRPQMRCLFPIEGIHVSRSLAKTIRSGRFTIRFDSQFEQVIRSCQRPGDNWISAEFIRCYTEAHEQGWAHSAEVFLGEALVGGTYGLALGTCFCAESMFHRETDASKVALWAMINRCRELGFTIFEAQIMNPHLKSLGAFEVTEEAYDEMLGSALKGKTIWSASLSD